MKKVTEKDIKNLKESLQQIVDTVLEYAAYDCNNIEDLDGFEYKISGEDIKYVLDSLRVDTIKFKEVKVYETPIDYYHFD